MSLSSDLEKEVKAILREEWDERVTTIVSAPKDLRLNSNHAKKLDSATVLYADLDGSTNMVDQYKWWFAAEMYKTYLRCASQIIKSEGGSITSYDGDRVMAIFAGDTKNTTAVRTAMKINRAVTKIIRPAIQTQYPKNTFTLKHVIGVDTSVVRAARTGVRGDNDVVWVGRAANYAAKLCALPKHPIWITKTVYDKMLDSVTNVNGKTMWSRYKWNTFDDSTIFGSNYYWGTI